MKRATLYGALSWLCVGLTWGELSVTAYAQPAAATAAAAEDATPESYKQAIELFMTGRAKDLDKQVKTKVADALRDRRHLDRHQRKVLVDMRRSVHKLQPDWWNRVNSSSNVSFKAGRADKKPEGDQTQKNKRTVTLTTRDGRKITIEDAGGGPWNGIVIPW